MEEQVVTSLDHSLILDYICDNKSTFACSYGDKSLNLYSSQEVSKLPGLGYTDMQEFCMHTLTFLTILLPLLTTYHTCCWSMFSPWSYSAAESASYMLTRDNHVVGVMSRESNKSRCASQTAA